MQRKLEKLYKDKVESRFNDYRQIIKKSFEKFINRKNGNIPISKELKRVDKSNLLVSNSYNKSYPSAMAHPYSKWLKIETTIAIKKEGTVHLCELFNTGEWKN